MREYSGSPAFTILTTDSIGLIQTRTTMTPVKFDTFPEKLDVDPWFSCRLAVQSTRFMGLRESFVL